MRAVYMPSTSMGAGVRLRSGSLRDLVSAWLMQFSDFDLSGIPTSPRAVVSKDVDEHILGE